MVTTRSVDASAVVPIAATGLTKTWVRRRSGRGSRRRHRAARLNLRHHALARAIPLRRYIDRGLTESARLPIDEVRAVRDEIDRRVRALVTE
jgi:hypothetical protein